MQDTPASPGVVVYQPPNPGHTFALHVARAVPGPSAARQVAAIPLPLPAHEDPETELAFRCLYLPMQMSPNMEVAPPGVEPALQRPWQQHISTGLCLPSHEARLRTLEDNTRAKTYLVPREVGLGFAPGVLARLAWMVLARLPAAKAALFVADTAVRCEVMGQRLSPAVVEAMRFGQPIGRRLRQLAFGGEMFFSHDALRWIVREVAAGDVTGAWAAAGLDAPSSGLDDQAAARVFFPSLLTGEEPPGHEVVRAVWALHETYTFKSDAFGTYGDNHEAILAMMTSIVAGQPQSGSWAPRMENWLRMLQLADHDPALAGIRLTPSAFRTAFRSTVGLEVDEWLAMLWFLGMRTLVLVESVAPLHREVRWLMSDSLETPLGARFETAFRSHTVCDLASLGQNVLSEPASGSYAGLGTLPTVESTSMRNAPFLEVAPDVVIPMGLHLLSERGVALPRLVVGPSVGSGGRQEVNGLIGKCFEALVRDVSVSARPRHRVLTGDDIDAVVPAGEPRCDAIITYMDHWLLVESGLQTLAQPFTQGRVATIQQKCAAYHEKGDQADATGRHLGAIARHHSMVPPRTVTNLVVTETTVFTVPLMDELRRQNRRRNPLFVTSLSEFEWLIAAGVTWSIPSLVHGWQAKEQPVPLLVYLWETSQLAPVQGPSPHLDPEAWITHLGTRLAA